MLRTLFSCRERFADDEVEERHELHQGHGLRAEDDPHMRSRPSKKWMLRPVHKAPSPTRRALLPVLSPAGKWETRNSFEMRVLLSWRHHGDSNPG
jgi:hypothetical protein